MSMNEEMLREYTCKVAGRNYTITSNDSPDYVHRVALFVDRRISEVYQVRAYNREEAAVVAALGLADELIRTQDENTRLRSEMQKRHANEKSNKL